MREIGSRWADAMEDRQAWGGALPVDPSAISFPGRVRPTGWGRVVEVEALRDGEPTVLEPADPELAEVSRWGRLLRRLLIGRPLLSSALVEERMRKLVALPVVGADLMASVAYGPEALLGVLALGGSVALGLAPLLAAALVALMVTVGLSYRQTVRAYPSGAGSYTVARENLGVLPGLTAAAGLVGDYVLNVAVSISTGVAAVTSALPPLRGSGLWLGAAMFAILLVGNLRGVRQSGAAFAWPTYVFLAAMALLIGAGLWHATGRGMAPVPASPVRALEPLGVLLVLRAFASGATAMTGIEAVSNSVPAFRPPEWRNGRTTLTWMVVLLVLTFSGVMLTLHLEGIAPRPDESLLSQLAHHAFGNGPLYGYVQAATLLMLLFGANTSYHGLPRLLFTLARDHHAPRAFLRLGDRLAFNNGVVALTATSFAVYLGFRGNLQALIPLFAVGVFLAFTLSQLGMVVHWWRQRGAGWRRSLALNAMGALMSSLVLVTAAAGKFLEGAWLLVIAIPLLIWLATRIRAHYDRVAEAVRLRPPVPGQPELTVQPRAASHVTPAAAHEEVEQSPGEIRHLAVVPVSRLDLANLRALAYACSLGMPVLAVHISPQQEQADRFEYEWGEWGDHVPLAIVLAPYRALLAPLVNYLIELHRQAPDVTLTIVLPELVVRRAWHRLLHANVAARLRRALRPLRGVVVTSVPFHLPA